MAVVGASDGSTGGSEEIQSKNTSLLSLQLTRTKTKKVVINWFSNGDSGTKLHYELEITEGQLVSDVIAFSTEYFSSKSGGSLVPQDFVLRPAKKDGKPKIEYPVLDSAQAVFSSGFLSFTLCPGSLKPKDAWVPTSLPEDDEKSSIATVESKESKDFTNIRSAEQPTRKDLPPAPANQGCCACHCF